MISVAVLAAVVYGGIFLLVFVVLYDGSFLFQQTLIQSFEVCLQINCLHGYIKAQKGAHCFLNWDSMLLD